MPESSRSCNVNDKTQTEGSAPPAARGSLLAAWIIGPYLALQTLTLAMVAVFAWLCSGWTSLSQWLPGVGGLVSGLPDAKFLIFQHEILAACSAGLGGAVFMIREFYINFAYGSGPPAQPRSFLKATEIPRYVLLPLSSFVLGPVGLALLQTGAILFSGFSAGHDVPTFTIVAVCFVLGFSYHDMLKALRELSRKLLSSPDS